MRRNFSLSIRRSSEPDSNARQDVGMLVNPLRAHPDKIRGFFHVEHVVTVVIVRTLNRARTRQACQRDSMHFGDLADKS